MADIDDVRARLEAIAEELADMALDVLREAVEQGADKRPELEKRTHPRPHRRREGRQPPPRLTHCRPERRVDRGRYGATVAPTVRMRSGGG